MTESVRPSPLLPRVVLVRPQEQGNVGAVARAMANTGLDDLVLVEPATAVGDVALARAVGARHLRGMEARAPGPRPGRSARDNPRRGRTPW